jgi:hypothetical protein
MARHGSGRIGIQPPLPHAAIRRIAHHGAKHACRQERRHRPHVRLHHIDVVSQTVAGDIELGRRSQFRLQFNTKQTRLRKTASQEQGNYPASRTQIKHRLVCSRRDKIGQEKSIEGKAVALLRLLQGQLPGTRHIYRHTLTMLPRPNMVRIIWCTSCLVCR